MARVYLDFDVEAGYSVCSPEDSYNGREWQVCDVPHDTVLRWLEVTAQYRQIQNEMREAFNRGIRRTDPAER